MSAFKASAGTASAPRAFHSSAALSHSLSQLSSALMQFSWLGQVNRCGTCVIATLMG